MTLTIVCAETPEDLDAAAPLFDLSRRRPAGAAA
jgi:hypothetical protein